MSAFVSILISPENIKPLIGIDDVVRVPNGLHGTNAELYGVPCSI